MDNQYRNFLTSLRYLIWLFAIGLTLFLTSRLAFLFIYGDLRVFYESSSELLNSFIIGFKYDFKVLGYGFLPLALLSLTQLLNRSMKIIYGFYYRISIFYGWFLLLFCTIISVLDFNFYKVHSTRISSLFFGISDNSPKIVFKAAWTDFTILIIGFSIFILSVLLFILLKWLFKKEIKWVYIQSSWLRTFSVFIFLGVYLIGLRGSVGQKPLDIKQSTISNDTFINTLGYNSVFALWTAYSFNDRPIIENNIPPIIMNDSTESSYKVIRVFLGRKDIDSINAAENLITQPLEQPLLTDSLNMTFVVFDSVNTQKNIE